MWGWIFTGVAVAVVVGVFVRGVWKLVYNNLPKVGG